MQLSSVDRESVDFFKLTVIKIFADIIKPKSQTIDVNLEHLLDIYIKNHSKIDVGDLLNLAEMFCILEPSLGTQKVAMNALISQALQDLISSIPERHPDENIQLLSQLTTLQRALPSEIETISYDFWTQLGTVFNLFEKNAISLFHLIEHRGPLLNLSLEWGFLLRDKFFYKLHEIIEFKKDSLHPQEILKLCVTLYRRGFLDAALIAPFREILSRKEVLSLLRPHQILQVLELDIEFDLLSRDKFDWVVESHADTLSNLNHLPELLDLYISLNANVASNRRAALEKSLNQLFSVFNKRIEKIDIECEEKKLSKNLNYFQNEEVIRAKFQRVMQIFKSNRYSQSVFDKKFLLVVRVLLNGWSLVGVKSQNTLLNVKHDIVCLGESYSSLLKLTKLRD